MYVIKGTFASANLNYRSKVEPSKLRAREINHQITLHLGFRAGNDSDLNDALGYETKVSANAPYAEWIAAYQETVKQVAQDYPKLSLIGTQGRGATNADMVSWGAVLYDVIEGKMYQAPLRENIPIAIARAAIRSPLVCWRLCSKAKTWRPPCSGEPRTASWFRRRPVIPR
jgi:hypothetical protein